MTLDGLSAKSGVSKSILSQIERDLSNPTVTTISRIAEALDEKLSDFFLKIEVEETSSIESLKEGLEQVLTSLNGSNLKSAPYN